MGAFYEAVVAAVGKEPKLCANWVMGDFSAFLNRDGLELVGSKVSAAALAGLIARIADNTISNAIGKKVFEALWNGQTPGTRLLGLRVLSAEGQPITGLQAILRNVLRAVDYLPLCPIPGSETLMPVLPLYMFGLVACSMNHR